MAFSPQNAVPILNKHLNSYVPERRQLGIACKNIPHGGDKFTEVKIVHNDTIQYTRTYVKDNPQGEITVNKFQEHVRKTYRVHLRREDQAHFGTEEKARRALETLFRQIAFKHLVFGTFEKMSSNVRDLVEMAVEYGMEHLGKSMHMAATAITTNNRND